jgi:hypothetical protein
MASELEHKENLSKEMSRAEILENLTGAKEELKIAELLGYGAKDDYKPLYTAMDEIKDVVHTAKSEATWAKVKQAFKDFKNKLTPSSK